MQGQILTVFATIAITQGVGLFKQEGRFSGSRSLSPFRRTSSPVPQLPFINFVDTCDCTGTNDTGDLGASYICHDPRLGPTSLPTTFPLLSFVSDYDRFGGQTPGDFLKRWTDGDGYYIYPPQDGFQLNDAGQPILGNMTLLIGTKVDRFGSEYGMVKFRSSHLGPANLLVSRHICFRRRRALLTARIAAQ